MERLVNRVSELEKSSNPLSRVVTVPRVTIPGHTIYQAEPSSRFTLKTAMSVQPRHNNINSNSDTCCTDLNVNQPGVFNQIQGVRTEGGYSSESLPDVELVSPMIRRKII